MYAYKVREGDITTLGAVGEARWTYVVSKLATEQLAHNYFCQQRMPPRSGHPSSSDGFRERKARKNLRRIHPRHDRADVDKLREYPVSFAEMVLRHNVCIILVNA